MTSNDNENKENGNIKGPEIKEASSSVTEAAAETASSTGIKQVHDEDMFSLDEWKTSDFIS
jgi:hypothetical protein